MIHIGRLAPALYRAPRLPGELACPKLSGSATLLVFTVRTSDSGVNAEAWYSSYFGHKHRLCELAQRDDVVSAIYSARSQY